MVKLTTEDIATLNSASIPRHIAIIQDGNRRWATQRGESLAHGHRSGMQATLEIIRTAAQLGVRTLTLYSFSTENWSRSAEEVAFLMTLLEMSLVELQDEMITQGVRLQVIGDLTPLPESLRLQIEKSIAATHHGTAIEVVLAINYGSRDELKRAAQRMIRDQQAGRLDVDRLDEATFASYLDTASFVDPELLIRTSGESRISNFLLWQISYAELYFTQTLWPDFTPKHLLEAIREYQTRTKRLGA